MGKVFLMQQHNNNVLYILEEEEEDNIRAWKDGKPSIFATDIIYEAEDLSDMLHQMQDNKDWRFYVVLDWIDNTGARGSTEYPHHRHICTLAGFIREVCDIRREQGKLYCGRKWKVEYCSELWYCPDGWNGSQMWKVKHFGEKMENAVFSYMEEHGLKLDMPDGQK